MALGSSNLWEVLGEAIASWHAGFGTFLNKLAYVVPCFLMAAQASIAESPVYACIFFF